MNPGDVQRLYAAEQFFIIAGNAGGDLPFRELIWIRAPSGCPPRKRAEGHEIQIKPPCTSVTIANIEEKIPSRFRDTHAGPKWVPLERQMFSIIARFGAA